MAGKVSVVTGANKGVGFAIVRALCKQVCGTVILAARNQDRGLAAIKALEEEGLTAVFEELDICSEQSIAKFVEAVKQKYGGVDIFCNNAGIAYKHASMAPLVDKSVNTMETNLIGTKNMTEAILPVMKPNGRICQVASMCGILNRSFADENNPVRVKLVNPNLTEPELMKIYDEYMDAVKQDDYSLFKKDSAYTFSKCLLIAYTRIMGRKLAEDPRKILINCCCPGWVDTDMSSHKGPLTVDEGAVTPVMVCLLPDGSAIGEFYRESKRFDWENNKYF